MITETETETFTPEPEERDDDTILDEPPAADADPVHLAKCAECAEAVRYRSNVTGTGFFLVDDAPDVTFGIGPNGRPVCLNGHGEMAIADDRLKSVPEAFADAQTMLQRAESEAAGYVQGALPGVFPAFNFEGAFKEIVEQAQTVETLKAEYDSAKSEAADAKKALDKGAELLMRMTLEFERRRKEKPSDLPSEAPARTPCTWEAKHQGQTCPACAMDFSQNVIVRLIGRDVAAADAAAHADDVDALLAAEAIEGCLIALESIDTFIDRETVAGWSEQDRAAVLAYAAFKVALDAALAAGDPDPMTVTVEKPDILGKPHIPAAVLPGEHQVCSFCETVIRPASEIEAHGAYAETAYVGTDCAGKPNAGHRYPSNRGKKTAAARKITPQPKPKAAKAKGKKR